MAIKRKDVIENTGEMCVAKGLYLATWNKKLMSIDIFYEVQM